MRHTDSVASISVLHRWLSTMQKVEGYEISHIFSCLFTFFEWIVQMYRHFMIWYFFILSFPKKKQYTCDSHSFYHKNNCFQNSIQPLIVLFSNNYKLFTLIFLKGWITFPFTDRSIIILNEWSEPCWFAVQKKFHTETNNTGNWLKQNLLIARYSFKEYCIQSDEKGHEKTDICEHSEKNEKSCNLPCNYNISSGNDV